MLSLIELTVIRSVLAFGALLLVTKIMGRKQLSQMTFFDYVVGITIGSTASTMSVELENETLVTLTGIIVWASLAVITGWLVTRSQTFQRLIQGLPVPVVQRGKVLEANMRREQLTMPDLQMKMREKNVFQLQDVEAVYFEPDGQLSVQLRTEQEPLTPRTAGVPVANQPPPRTVIEDGKLIRSALHASGYEEDWLRAEMEQQGVRDPGQVALAQLTADGSLWLDRYDDRLTSRHPQARKLLLAQMLEVQAELERFAMETPNPRMRSAYAQMARDADTMLQETEPYLR